MKKRNRDSLGYFGEIYTMYKLAEMDIKCSNLPTFHDYDLMTANGVRIEVKTSSLATRECKIKLAKGGHTITTHQLYTFANHKSNTRFGLGQRKREYSRRVRSCDFYALICLDEPGKTVMHSYIVPNKEMPGGKLIAIRLTSRSKYKVYENDWAAISKLEEELAN
jgi:hypothetical protein